ncbi:arginase-1-like [Panonychus citri]|uniref:arginase-1-like n=1 Tax=Panonychus citri TaxID=50023 RepID=UPI002306E648|nr:arginase-1-like [Panonychus citri]
MVNSSKITRLLFSFSTVPRLQKQRFHSSQQSTKRIGLVGGCFDKGQPKEGVELGPKVIRANGLIQRFENHHIDYKDYGDISVKDIEDNQANNQPLEPIKGLLKNTTIIANYSKLLSDKVYQCLQEDRISLNLGGDHTLAIGSLLGHFRHNQKFSVLWIDAHADVNTEFTTTTGNLHGMSLSFFLQGIQSEYENSPQLTKLFHSIQPNLNSSSLCYIGLRDLDPLERHLLDSLQIKYFTMGDVDKLGISEITSRALEILKPTESKPLHVSFDVDSLDPSYAPSTGTPVPGGLTLDEAQTLAKTINSTNLLKCLDWVEVNPKIGSPKDSTKTVDNSIKLILSFLGNV